MAKRGGYEFDRTAYWRRQHLKLDGREAEKKSITPEQKSGWDIWLSRTSHIAQVGLLVLGVFVYFYTIIPVAQKEKLAEDYVKLEKEYARTETEIVARTKDLKNIDAQLENTTLLLAEKEKSLTETEKRERQVYSSLRGIVADIVIASTLNICAAVVVRIASFSEDSWLIKDEPIALCVDKQLNIPSLVTYLSQLNAHDHDSLRTLLIRAAKNKFQEAAEDARSKHAALQTKLGEEKDTAWMLDPTGIISSKATRGSGGKIESTDSPMMKVFHDYDTRMTAVSIAYRARAEAEIQLVREKFLKTGQGR